MQKGLKSMKKKLTEKYRAVLDDNTAISLYSLEDRNFFIVRKNLIKNYELEVMPSEAPMLNRYVTPEDAESYEHSLLNINILEDQILPIEDTIKILFGDDKFLDLKSVRLAIGSNANDYIGIDEKDLQRKEIKATLNGLYNFIKQNEESIVGFLDRDFIAEEGNVIYLDFEANELTENINSIKIVILASMQQRSLFLQNEQKIYGTQLFIVIDSNVEYDEQITEFLRTLDIEFDFILMKRNLAIENWIEIECEQNNENIEVYLREKYPLLNYFDTKNIFKLVERNDLDILIIDKMADLLSALKNERANGGDCHSITLKKAEIIASIKIANILLGRKEITVDFDNTDNSITEQEILKYQKELTN